MGQFAITRRTQHAAAEADDSGSVVVFDLFMGFDDEAQARHIIFTKSPFDESRFVGELGAGVSKEKLAMGKDGPVVVQPGAEGRREDGQSVSADNTTTRIEMIDSGEVEIVSDEVDSKIFTFVGQKLQGRMQMLREGDTPKFNISIENQIGGGGGEHAGGQEDDEDDEDDSDDPPKNDVDDFVSPEFDEVLRTMIEEKNLSDDIVARLRAIRQRLSGKEMTKRDVVFVLRLIAGGEEAAREAEKNEEVEIHLWNDMEWVDDEILFLDALTGDEYRLVRSADGTFTIPKFEFIVTGEHNGIDFDRKKIQTIVKNFSLVTKSQFLDVPIKIGHHRNQTLKGDKGELAHGWATDAWSESFGEGGERGFLKLEGIPRALAFLINKKALKNRSAEIFTDIEFKGERIGPTLKAISLLGTSTPAVRGMQPAAAAPLDSIVQMYEEDGNQVIIANLRRNESMPDKNEPKKKDEDKLEVIQLSQAELDAKIAEAASKAAEDTAKKLGEVHKKDTEELKGQLTELSSALKGEKATRRKQAIKSALKENDLQFEALVKDGNVLPAQKDEYLALAKILDGVTETAKGHDLSDMLDGLEVDKDTMEFSVKVTEADKQVDLQLTPKDLLIRLLKGQKLVEFDTKSKDNKDDKKGDLDDAGKKKTHGEAVEELTQKLMKDEELSYADALEKAVEQHFGDEAHDKMNIEGL
jgi:hypothetical protein